MELQIWDTAGQEKFRSLAPLYYRGACGAIVVYDVTSRPSFEMLASWIDSFVSIVGIQGTIVIAGNKCDLEDFRQVSREEAVDWAAKHGYEMFETSAKTGQNIQLLVDRIAEDVLKAKLSDMQNKPSGLAGGASHSSCC
jgi:Ras-related protein Rab-2A